MVGKGGHLYCFDKIFGWHICNLCYHDRRLVGIEWSLYCHFFVWLVYMLFEGDYWKQYIITNRVFTPINQYSLTSCLTQKWLRISKGKKRSSTSKPSRRHSQITFESFHLLFLCLFLLCVWSFPSSCGLFPQLLWTNKISSCTSSIIERTNCRRDRWELRFLQWVVLLVMLRINKSELNNYAP